jgi:hypothetical protein
MARVICANKSNSFYFLFFFSEGESARLLEHHQLIIWPPLHPEIRTPDRRFPCVIERASVAEQAYNTLVTGRADITAQKRKGENNRKRRNNTKSHMQPSVKWILCRQIIYAAAEQIS